MRMTVPYAPAGGPAAGQARSLYLDARGARRRFVLYAPAGSTGPAMPLVLDLHGSTSYPEEQLAISAMTAAADEHRFAVLAPEGLDRAWNVPIDPAGPDDVGFIADAIELTRTLLPVDPARIYATGFSGGGRMVSTLAGALGDRLAAIAPVAGLRFDPAHAPSRPVPVLTFHGLDDPVNPFHGGGPSYWQTSIDDAVDAWTKQNRGDPQSVTVHRIAGMGHQWPGSPIDLGPPFGPHAATPDATALIAEFFRAPVHESDTE